MDREGRRRKVGEGQERGIQSRKVEGGSKEGKGQLPGHSASSV